MKTKDIKNLTAFFFEMGTLRKIIRMHQQALLTSDPSDNISSHSFRTAIMGYFLAENLKADSSKVVKMCLLHDIEETRCGDQNWVHKRYVKVFEEEIREGQLKKLPNCKEMLKLSEEYHNRKSLESKIAKDADTLDEIFLLREYEHQGNKEAADWLRGIEKNRGAKTQQEKRLFTDLAKKIAQEAKKQNPSLWWDSLWTPNRRK